MSQTPSTAARRCLHALLAALPLPLALLGLALPEAAAAAGAAPPAGAAAATSGPAKAASKAGKDPGVSGWRRPCPPHVPEALDPPAGATLAGGVAASGAQIYVCGVSKPGDAPVWTLEGPHATLSHGAEMVGIHFAGPTWQALDGSSIKGAKLAAADAPASTAVPWLLLSATASGHGVFGQVTHVQRLETAGGKAPSSGCDSSHIGEKVLAPYTASYFFYRPAAPGEAIHQCRSAH